MRLGRLPHDPVRVADLSAHRLGAIEPPKTLDRTREDFLPGLYGNDILPDCTAVAIANAARGVAHLNGYDLVIDPDKVPALYGACIGNPPDLAITTGARLLDVIDYQGARGYDVGPQILVAHAGRINLARYSMASALAALGPIILGVTLYDRDMDASGVWKSAEGKPKGDPVGGHAVIGWCYEGLSQEDLVYLGTWGRWQPVTWRWLADQADEAYGLVWRQLAKADGTFYAGVSADGLLGELPT